MLILDAVADLEREDVVAGSRGPGRKASGWETAEGANDGGRSWWLRAGGGESLGRVDVHRGAMDQRATDADLSKTVAVASAIIPFEPAFSACLRQRWPAQGRTAGGRLRGRVVRASLCGDGDERRDRLMSLPAFATGWVSVSRRPPPEIAGIDRRWPHH